MLSSFRPVIVLAMCLSAGAAFAGDIGAMAKNCNDCHGDKGVSQWTDVPTIAGISESVLADSLYNYRDKARPCEDSKYRQGDTSRAATNMCSLAEGLSDGDIDDLAAHYADLPFAPAAQEFDEALAKAGQAVHEEHCDRCHSEGGSNPDDEASILAGQWMGYMERTLAEYRADERSQPKKMKEKIDALSDADIAGLLNFYASQK